MNLIQIRKATTLLEEYIDGSDTIVLDNGQMALQVYLKDGSQTVFNDIENVIKWLQIQKLHDNNSNGQ